MSPTTKQMLMERAGYPADAAPGASMVGLLPEYGGAFLTLPTDETEWDEAAHYAALPEDVKEIE